MNTGEALSGTDIWSIKDDVLEKNKQSKKEIYSIPEEDMISDNVNGFIINEHGNIVARFSFFVETTDTNKINLKISQDGFMTSVYKKPTNIIVGYSHPLKFSGLVDPSQSRILHLGPEKANGTDFVISLDNDEKLKNQGIVCLMRDVDVLTEILPNDVRIDFEESLNDASTPVDDLNEIEQSYNSFMKHIYVVLGENFDNSENIVEKEEVYEWFY